MPHRRVEACFADRVEYGHEHAFQEAEGRLTLEVKDIQVGKHKLIAWQPVVGQIGKAFVVKEAGSARTELDIT
ncbi:hypothetical protein [Petrachloros mirabilis]